MFHWMMTPMNRHFDYGFGVTADAFKEAANHLAGIDYKHADEPVSPSPEEDLKQRLVNIHIPINYLYRHAVELFLKSLIVVVHRRLRLPFGEESHEAEPKIRIGGEWKSYRRVHSVQQLFDYFKALTEENRDALRSIATQDWSAIPAELAKWIETIERYDARSTYSRYPDMEDRRADENKSSFKPSSLADITPRPGKKAGVNFLVLDEDDNITAAYRQDESPLEELREALVEATETLSGAHIGMRATLTGGW